MLLINSFTLYAGCIYGCCAAAADDDAISIAVVDKRFLLCRLSAYGCSRLLTVSNSKRFKPETTTVVVLL